MVQLWDTPGLQSDLKHRDLEVCPALTPTPASHTGSIWGNKISSVPGGHSSWGWGEGRPAGSATLLSSSYPDLPYSSH